MCGILVLLCPLNDEGMKSLVQKYYLKQLRQGSEGFGLLLKKKRNGRIYRRRTETSQEIFSDKIWKRVKAGDLLVFHHRNPTSTPNLPECNHPLSNESKSIYLAHIGIISSIDHLEEDHWFESEIEEIIKTRNRTLYYKSYTDSELALHRLEEILEKKDRVTAMKQLCEEFYGSAFIVVFSDEDRIYLSSNSGCNLWSYGDCIASSRLWKRARQIQNKYGYFDGKLVTKDIKPRVIYRSKSPTLKEGFYGEKEGFYGEKLSEFLQERNEYCLMDTDCEECLLLEQCEDDFQYFYGFYDSF